MDINFIFMAGNFFSVIMSFGIAIFVICNNPKSRLNIFFIIFNLLVGLWCLAPVLINLDFFKNKLLIQRIGYIFGIFIVPIFFEMVYSIEKRKYLQRFKFIAYIMSYILVIFIFTKYFIPSLAIIGGLYQSSAGIIYYFFIGYFSIGITSTLYFLSKIYHQEKLNDQKKDIARFLFWGYGVGYIGGFIYFCTILCIIPTYTFAGYFVSAGAFILFYAVIKYDWNIDREVKEITFQNTIKETTKTLIEVSTKEELSKNIIQLLGRDTNAKELRIFCINTNKYINYLNHNETISFDNYLVDILTQKRKMLERGEVERWAEEIGTNLFIEVLELFKKYNAKYILPLFFGELVGFVFISEKRSNEDFTTKDFQTFDYISFAGAIALANIIIIDKSYIDGLTGLYNKQFFNEKMLELLAREENIFSFLFIDIDNFSKLNETLGHANCDEKLKELSKILKEHFRINDILCRWGGEEFCVILPEITEKDTKRIATEVLHIIQTELEITASCGISFYDGKKYEDKNINQLQKLIIDEADRKLYQAKHEGKNRVIA